MNKRTATRACAAACALIGAVAWAGASDAPLKMSAPSLAHQTETEAGEETQTEVDVDIEESEVDEDETGYGGAGDDTYRYEEKQEFSGLYALIGGGGESYTGDIGDLTNLSPSATVAVGFQAPILGLEASYNGGGVEVDVGEQGLGGGFDILRHSAQAAVTAGLTGLSFPVQPYILSGGGIDWFNVRNQVATGDPGTGFSDASSFYVPAGAGLRAHVGDVFTIDGRYTYDFMFGEDFAPVNVEGNRMQALLTVGGQF